MDIPIQYRMLGQSLAFTECWVSIEKYARHNASVLISGETGTGKELVARALHYLGKRSHGPFIPINCGAIPESLLESEFFGHRAGAFTDARVTQAGLVEQAAGGTLFLDEIEALSDRGQIILLRFLQDHHYRAVGGRQEEVADVRVLAATNVELSDLIDRGTFRRDLMYRLKTLVLNIPPLRARLTDIDLIAEALLKRWSLEIGVPVKRLSPNASHFLRQHDWPGNIRELENVLLASFIAVEDQEIGEEYFFGGLLASEKDRAENDLCSYRVAKRTAVNNFEYAYLTKLITVAKGNITEAAKISHQHRTALSKLMKKHRIVPLPGKVQQSS